MEALHPLLPRSLAWPGPCGLVGLCCHHSKKACDAALGVRVSVVASTSLPGSGPLSTSPLQAGCPWLPSVGVGCSPGLGLLTLGEPS